MSDPGRLSANQSMRQSLDAMAEQCKEPSGLSEGGLTLLVLPRRFRKGGKGQIGDADLVPGGQSFHSPLVSVAREEEICNLADEVPGLPKVPDGWPPPPDGG